MASTDVPDVPHPRSGGRLASLVGLPTAGALLAVIALWEGYRPIGYSDLGGIPTVCWGDTEGAIIGRRYSRAECEDRLERQALAHVEPVLRCTPVLRGRHHQLVAAGSLTYNIGARAYCRSTVARRFNSGEFRGACDAFLMWNRANGRVVRGLVNRRRYERDLCLRGIDGGPE